MRTNLPVTNKEIMLEDRQSIVSKTDLKGRITYVNQDFLDISGFTEQELIGQPHNIVRHPDMPAEAFADLWRDILAGRPWVGYVKNRCKNGDFYWVEAHAAPIWENGQMVGVMSLRRKPARDKVAACEAAYRLFREKRAAGLCIEHGGVVKRGRGLQSFLRDACLWQRLAIGFGPVIGLGLLAGLLGAMNVADAGTRIQILALLAAIPVVGVAAAVWLLRSIGKPLASFVGILRHLSGGHYDIQIDVVRNDEVGAVQQGLETMINRLGFEMAETTRQADAMTRVKIALDNVSTGVMIADANRTVIYANHAVQRLLKEAENAIRSQLPDFSADQVVGHSIDRFHKNPSHQAGMLGNLTAPHTANLEMGGRQLRITASPVINAAGQRLGAVAEWIDRTAEVAIETEVADIVSAATMGNLSTRLDMSGKSGFFASLAEGLNLLLDNTQQSLKATSEVLSRVARGDLTQTIDADFKGVFGQLKDDTNSTIERLREVLGRIKEASETINIASQEIAAGNSDLSSRTEQQASSLEETSSSMEQLNATVKQNAENARQANHLSKNSNEIATRGGQMVKQVVTTMNGIQDSSKKIADIIGVIDSIAFQTNILALNAAVEAARAGEQGRGFAVVATEVRNLAQRSATAAKEIKQLIAESVTKVDSGAKLVGDAGNTMDEVVSSFHEVAQLVTEIASASSEQSSGIEQVTQAVSQMDEVTQQNAALVEQAAAAAESLEEQTQELVKAVGMFKLVEGTGPAKRPAGPAAGLRDATPRQLPRPSRPAAPPPSPSPGRKLAPPGGAKTEESWEEF